MKAKQITNAQVVAFFKAKAEKLQASSAGYTSLKLENHSSANGSVRPLFVAYNEHSGHSSEFDNADEAIAWVASKTKGKTESEMVRAKAAALLLKASALEAEEKLP